MQKYVLGFMFDPFKNKVVLLKKLKPKWQEGWYNGVGGKVEEIDKNSKQSMVREFEEETGVSTLEDEWESLLEMKEDGKFSVEVFYCFSDKYIQATTMEEEIVCIFDLSEDWQFIRANSISNIPWLIMASLDTDAEIKRLKLSAEYV